ncbi:hypothetical protein [Paenibacillus vini]|uniref:Uncharacterized protein n=1 Tax=Paenibacillus vini TaxID=1476024 RepID=A0ABQ4MKJ7_9BACL|nr:hypothetical protein [Paenibacillus vini]GIP55945.1 hypothetical protein J42TS3_49800 [Paenibacillus vini]
MPDELKLTKKIVLELDVVNGEVTFDNPDDMTNFEAIGLLEYTKMMLYRDSQD